MRNDGQERRAEIVATALRLARADGLGNLTTRRLTDELGVSRGLLFHYFPTRDDLVAAAFEHAAEEELDAIRRAVSSTEHPVERLRALIELSSPPRGKSSFLLWIDASGEAQRNPALARTARRVNRAWHRTYVDIIDDGVAAGVMRCDDPSASAWRIMSALDGLALQALAYRAFPRKHIAPWALDVVAREVGLPS